MAEKHRIIDAIREINPTAAAEWLAAFPMAELERYHRRLMELIERVRTGEPRRSESSADVPAGLAVAGHDFF